MWTEVKQKQKHDLHGSFNWVNVLIDLKCNTAYLFTSWSRLHTIYTVHTIFKSFMIAEVKREVSYCNFDHCG